LSRDGISPLPNRHRDRRLEWYNALPGGAGPDSPLTIPTHSRASEEATVLRDTAASDDLVVVLFLSLVGFDLSLWLLSRGFLELLL
jgi:hypothetical protein